MKIEEIDKNFQTAKVGDLDVRYYDALKAPFELEGYANAVRAGDKKVWLVDGKTLFGIEDRDACTVDGTHPNDLGFYRMFRTILPTLAKALPAQK